MAMIASQQRQPPFDLIIAEQLPPQQLPQTHTNDGSNSGDVTVTSNTNTSMISGGALLFHNLPQEHRDQMLLISVAPSSCSNNKAPISKSTISTTNAVTTTLSDFVWSKPPPRMDNNLRIHLIRTLQTKREQYMENSKKHHQPNGE